MRLNRREPWSRFILTLGTADMVIGGAGHSFSLFLLGLTTLGVGLLVRWARLKPRSLYHYEEQAMAQATPQSLPQIPKVPSSARRDSSNRADAGSRSRSRRIY